MLQYVYQAIKKKLLHDVPEINQVDWFYEQYENTEEGNLVWTTPSVYVEYPETVRWVQRGANYQMATINITLHVVSASAYGAEDMRQVEMTDGLVISHLDLCQKVYAAIQKFFCNYSYLAEFPNEESVLLNQVVRTETEVSHNLSVFNVTKMTFTATIHDVNAMPVQVEVMPPIGLDLEVVPIIP